MTARAARSIKGRVVFSGAAWYHPDYRGKQLSTIVPILSRAYAFTHWNVDYLVAMMSEGVVSGGMTLRTGYTNIDWDSRRGVCSPGCRRRGQKKGEMSHRNREFF